VAARLDATEQEAAGGFVEFDETPIAFVEKFQAAQRGDHVGRPHITIEQLRHGGLSSLIGLAARHDGRHGPGGYIASRNFSEQRRQDAPQRTRIGRPAVTPALPWLPVVSTKSLILLVPGERIELPTNGLQNRCSTAELTRQRLY
jgi:hypothetical protein